MLRAVQISCPRRGARRAYRQGIPGGAERRPHGVGGRRARRQRGHTPHDPGVRPQARRLLRPAPPPGPPGRHDVRGRGGRPAVHDVVPAPLQGRPSAQAALHGDGAAGARRRGGPAHPGCQQLRPADLRRRPGALEQPVRRHRREGPHRGHHRLLERGAGGRPQHDTGVRRPADGPLARFRTGRVPGPSGGRHLGRGHHRTGREGDQHRRGLRGLDPHRCLLPPRHPAGADHLRGGEAQHPGGHHHLPGEQRPGRRGRRAPAGLPGRRTGQRHRVRGCTHPLGPGVPHRQPEAHLAVPAAGLRLAALPGPGPADGARRADARSDPADHRAHRHLSAAAGADPDRPVRRLPPDAQGTCDRFGGRGVHHPRRPLQAERPDVRLRAGVLPREHRRNGPRGDRPRRSCLAHLPHRGSVAAARTAALAGGVADGTGREAARPAEDQPGDPRSVPVRLGRPHQHLRELQRERGWLSRTGRPGSRRPAAG